MSKRIRLENSAGAIITAPAGFSFTVLFFGPFPPLFRGDLRGFAIACGFYFIGYFILPWILFPIALLILPATWITFPFLYNKMYIRSMQSQGYKPADEESKAYLREKGLFAGE